MVYYSHKARQALQGVTMQNAIVNLIMASVLIFSAFAIGCAVKTACNSKIKTDALFACRVFYIAGLIIGIKSLLIMFN